MAVLRALPAVPRALYLPGVRGAGGRGLQRHNPEKLAGDSPRVQRMNLWSFRKRPIFFRDLNLVVLFDLFGETNNGGLVHLATG